MPRRPALRERDRALARAIVAWFRRGRRALPWRTTPRDPYRTWVAEVLLQQTRVAQAVPYFERFVATFPDVATLARARPDRVLKRWQGAGYYARARRLHEAARAIVDRHGGTVPRSPVELERLPGVGRYTARAIAAIAFDEPVVAVDANVLRVAARWFLVTGDVRRPSVRATLEQRLDRAIPAGDAATFAEGLMELGETVCLPRRPRCDRCPAAFGCRAVRARIDPADLPVRATHGRRPHVRAAVVVWRRRGRWLVQRRPPTGLLGGLWEFPGGKIEAGERPEAAARRELREEVGSDIGPLRPLGVVRHGYSHFTVELHVFRADGGPPTPPSPQRRWLPLAAVERLPLPRATEKIVRLLRPRSRRELALSRPARGRSRPAPSGSPRRDRAPRTGARASPARRAPPPPVAALRARGGAARSPAAPDAPAAPR